MNFATVCGALPTFHISLTDTQCKSPCIQQRRSKSAADAFRHPRGAHQRISSTGRPRASKARDSRGPHEWQLCRCHSQIMEPYSQGSATARPAAAACTGPAAARGGVLGAPRSFPLISFVRPEPATACHLVLVSGPRQTRTNQRPECWRGRGRRGALGARAQAWGRTAARAESARARVRWRPPATVGTCGAPPPLPAAALDARGGSGRRVWDPAARLPASGLSLSQERRRRVHRPRAHSLHPAAYPRVNGRCAPPAADAAKPIGLCVNARHARLLSFCSAFRRRLPHASPRAVSFPSSSWTSSRKYVTLPQRLGAAFSCWCGQLSGLRALRWPLGFFFSRPCYCYLLYAML